MVNARPHISGLEADQTERKVALSSDCVLATELLLEEALNHAEVLNRFVVVVLVDVGVQRVLHLKVFLHYEPFPDLYYL